MAVIASSLVPRYPSPKLVKEVWTVRTIGTMRKTVRKNVPGKRYLAGTNLLVEYRRNMAIVARVTIPNHIHIR